MKVAIFLILASCLTAVCSGQTWLGEALRCQDYLQRDMPINIGTVPLTHNSFNSKASGYNLAPNQKVSLTEQLNLGVRGLELDIHDIPALTPSVRICHGSQDTRDACQNKGWAFCNLVGIFDYGASTGCQSSSKTVPETFDEIATWVKASTNEFVMVWFELEGNIDPTYINDAITTAFPSSTAKVFTPDDLLNYGSYPTFEELANDNFKIMFLSPGNNFGGSQVHDIAQWPGFPHKKIKYFQPSTCQSTSLGTPPPDPVLFGIFYGDESALLGIVDGPSDVGVLDETNAPGLYDCGYSAAFDNVRPNKLKSTVWSWDKSKPTKNTTLNCGAMGGNGFWYDESCNASLYFACQSTIDHNQWAISTQPGTWSQSAGKCPTDYVFAAPSLSIENAYLKKAKIASGRSAVWIQLNDITTEGTWQRSVAAETGELQCISTGVEDVPDIEESTATGGDESFGVVIQASIQLIAFLTFLAVVLF